MAAPKVVNVTTSSAAIDENDVSMTIFPFLCAYKSLFQAPGNYVYQIQ